MNRDDVSFRVVELCELADKIFGTKLFGNVSVGFFSKGTAAGLAYTNGRVEFNEVLMERHPEEFDTTIIHEVAHIVTFKVFPNAKQNHGPEFKRVMRMLGADNPTRCHSYDVSGLKRYNTVKRFEYVCEAGCVHSLTIHRHKTIESGKVRCRCAKHGTYIKFTGVVAEIKRTPTQ